MLYALLSFAVAILILLLIVYLIKLVLDYLELDPPIRKVAMVIVAIIAIIFLVATFASLPLATCKTLFCQ